MRVTIGGDERARRNLRRAMDWDDPNGALIAAAMVCAIEAHTTPTKLMEALAAAFEDNQMDMGWESVEAELQREAQGPGPF